MTNLSFNLFKKVVSAGVCLSFFIVNGPLAYSSEANFWSSRRAAGDQMRRNGVGVGNAGSTDGQMLLAQLPKAGPLEFGQVVTSSADQEAQAPKEPFSIGPKTGDWLGKLVLPYGSVREVYLSPDTKAPFIVHIQDAHGIEEAQRNISSMIGQLAQEPGISLVGLEGASGSFSLEPYRDYPDASITKDIADLFLKKGLIAGPEYAGLTLPKSPDFFGVEDHSLYTANVDALKKAFKGREGAQETLASLQKFAEKLKDTHFSTELKTFDRHFSDYHSDKEKLATYVRYILDTHQSLQKSRFTVKKIHPLPGPLPLPGEGGKPGPKQLALLVKALDEEESLDFSRVELERKQLVERLVGKLSAGQIQDLVAKSVDYRAGRVGYGDYHNHLKKMCVAHGIKFSEWPQLNRYLSYVLLADKIDRNELLNEMEALDRSIPERLARNEKERQLVAVAFDLSLVAKLIRHEMSVADWTAYESRMGEIHRLAARLTALDSSVKVKGLTAETLKPYEDFCFYASRRNNALTDNLLRQMADTKGKSAVLVAGGFHTEGLSALLRKKQVSYVVVTPKISAIPKDNDYLDVMANDPLPLEKQLAGDRIYLAKAIELANQEGSSGRALTALGNVLQRIENLVEYASNRAFTSDPTLGEVVYQFSVGGRTVYLVKDYQQGSSILRYFSSLLPRIKISYTRGTALFKTWARSVKDDIYEAPFKREFEEIRISDISMFLSKHPWVAGPVTLLKGWVSMGIIAGLSLTLLAVGPGSVLVFSGVSTHVAIALSLSLAAVAALRYPEKMGVFIAHGHAIQNSLARGLKAVGIPILEILNLNPLSLEEYVRQVNHEISVLPEITSQNMGDTQAIQAFGWLIPLTESFEKVTVRSSSNRRDRDIRKIERLTLEILNFGLNRWLQGHSVTAKGTPINSKVPNFILSMINTPSVNIDLRQRWANGILNRVNENPYFAQLLLLGMAPNFGTQFPEIAYPFLGPIPQSVSIRHRGILNYLIHVLQSLKNSESRLSYLLIRIYSKQQPFLTTVFEDSSLSPEVRLYAAHRLFVDHSSTLIKTKFNNETDWNSFRQEMERMADVIQARFSGDNGLTAENDRTLQTWFSDPWLHGEDLKVYLLAATVLARKRRGFKSLSSMPNFIRIIENASLSDNASNVYSDMYFSGNAFKTKTREGGYSSAAFALTAEHEINHRILDYDALFPSETTDLPANKVLTRKTIHEFLSDTAAGELALGRRIDFMALFNRAYVNLHNDHGHGIARIQLQKLTKALGELRPRGLLDAGYALVMNGEAAKFTSPREFLAAVIGGYLGLSSTQVSELKKGTDPTISAEEIRTMLSNREKISHQHLGRKPNLTLPETYRVGRYLSKHLFGREWSDRAIENWFSMFYEAFRIFVPSRFHTDHENTTTPDSIWRWVGIGAMVLAGLAGFYFGFGIGLEWLISSEQMGVAPAIVVAAAGSFLLGFVATIPVHGLFNILANTVNFILEQWGFQIPRLTVDKNQSAFYAAFMEKVRDSQVPVKVLFVDLHGESAGDPVQIANDLSEGLLPSFTTMSTAGNNQTVSVKHLGPVTFDLSNSQINAVRIQQGISFSKAATVGNTRGWPSLPDSLKDKPDVVVVLGGNSRLVSALLKKAGITDALLLDNPTSNYAGFLEDTFFSNLFQQPSKESRPSAISQDLGTQSIRINGLSAPDDVPVGTTVAFSDGTVLRKEFDPSNFESTRWVSVTQTPSTEIINPPFSDATSILFPGGVKDLEWEFLFTDVDVSSPEILNEINGTPFPTKFEAFCRYLKYYSDLPSEARKSTEGQKLINPELLRNLISAFGGNQTRGGDSTANDLILELDRNDPDRNLIAEWLGRLVGTEKGFYEAGGAPLLAKKYFLGAEIDPVERLVELKVESHPERGHAVNEDSFFTLTLINGIQINAIFDGVSTGGMGKQASQEASSFVQDHLKEKLGELDELPKNESDLSAIIFETLKMAVETAGIIVKSHEDNRATTVLIDVIVPTKGGHRHYMVNGGDSNAAKISPSVQPGVAWDYQTLTAHRFSNNNGFLNLNGQPDGTNPERTKHQRNIVVQDAALDIRSAEDLARATVDAKEYFQNRALRGGLLPSGAKGLSYLSFTTGPGETVVMSSDGLQGGSTRDEIIEEFQNGPRLLATKAMLRAKLKLRENDIQKYGGSFYSFDDTMVIVSETRAVGMDASKTSRLSNLNNIFIRLLSLFASKEVAQKWGMRLLPIEIGGIVFAGWMASAWGAALVPGLLMLDPAGVGALVMLGGLVLFKGLHYGLAYIQFGLGRGEKPVLSISGFAREFGYFLPYVALPFLASNTVLFAAGAAVAAYIHYSYDSKLLSTEKTAEAIVDKINTTTDPTEKMALNAVVGDLMMKGRVSGMNLKRVSGGSAYWTQQDLVQTLMKFGDGKAIAALQSSEAKSNAINVLTHLMVQEGQGPGVRMLLDFMSFNLWDKEVQETAKTMIEGLTKAGQPVLLLHDGTGDTNAVLAELGITLNSTQMNLIDTQEADPGITMTQVVLDYNARTIGKGVPLASTVLVQDENSIQMDLKGFQSQKYSDLSKAIQKAIGALIAVLQAA